jgi:signal transduction histidine kinase/HD-like signal output (HDOD) protein/CheY-like chemotaxis protein
MINNLNLEQIPIISKTIIDIFKYERKNPIEFSQRLPEIIAKDPGLSSKILKLANSPYYGLMGKISTVTHAINLLGVETVKNIALRSSITDIFIKLHGDKIVKDIYIYFLKRGLIAGVFSKVLCETLGLGTPESFLLRGSLLKIGNIALIMNYEERYDFDVENTDDSVLIDMEREKFGTDSVEVGKYLVEHWNFPYEFYQSIDNHVEIKHNDHISKVAYISNLFSELLLLKDEPKRKMLINKFKTKLKKIFNLSFSDIDIFKGELELEIKLFIEGAPEFNDNCKEIVEVFDKIQKKLVEEIQGLEEINKKLSELKSQLASEKKYLKLNLRFAKSLSWISEPKYLINKILHQINYLTKKAEAKFIFWDIKSKQFYAYKLNGSKNNIYIYDLKKAPLYEKSYKLREIQIKNFDNNILVVIPVFYETTSYGIIPLLFEDRKDYSAEIVGAVETAANVVANAFNNYYSNERVKKEIIKKYVMFDEIKNGMFDNQRMKEIIKELQLYNIHKYILRSIIHKLNNKLTPIIGYAQMIEGKVADVKTNERISIIRKNSDEVVRILNKLFEQFSSPVLQKEVININLLIKEKIQLIDYKIKEEGIKIEYDLEDGLPDIYFSRVQLGDVIMNLIMNAIEAVKQTDKSEKEIKVKTYYDSMNFYIRISDNGIGIDEKIQEKIFEPFFTTYDDKNGLGLNFVHGFVNANQGSIDIKSEVGVGTVITISFYAKTIKKTDKGKIDKSNFRILIVDDEESLVELLSEFLNYEGLNNISTAKNGEQAIDLIKTSKYDLIITDIRMPKVSGIELYYWLKKEKKDVDIIFVTAEVNSEELNKIINNDRIPVLQKPFSLMEFTGLIYESISKKYLEV